MVAMLAADLTIKLDLNFGQVDYALIERVVHDALTEAHIPVVDVEMDGTRDLAAPLSEQLGAPDLQNALAPYTRPPGAVGFPTR